jgi:SAM-dependent methyltransferase
LACGLPFANARADGHPFVVCTSCGTARTWPPPVTDLTSDSIFVGSYGGQRLARRSQWFHEADARLDWLAARNVRSGRLLEVGSGTGEFLVAAERRGFDAVGVETSLWAVEEAGKAGASAVVYGTLEALGGTPHASAPFQAAALFHVIEHLHDPLAVLSTLREQFLGPGALVLGEVPNFASRHAQTDPLSWQNLNVADHVSHFTPDGLEMLLRRAGYHDVVTEEVTHKVYDPPALWRSRRRGWLKRGILRASRDLLRVAAYNPAKT